MRHISFAAQVIHFMTLPKSHQSVNRTPGLVGSLPLLSTPPRGDAVTSSPRPGHGLAGTGLSPVRSALFDGARQHAGRGRSALRYLAAYVKKTAFHQDRLEGFDAAGRIILRYRDSADNALKREALTPHELIRRWLLHVLPKGLVRVRHYGWLSPAAHKALRRVRFLLGLGPCRVPSAEPSEPPRCPCCQGPLAFLGSIGPVRGPPLSRLVLA